MKQCNRVDADRAERRVGETVEQARGSQPRRLADASEREMRAVSALVGGNTDRGEARGDLPLCEQKLVSSRRDTGPQHARRAACRKRAGSSQRQAKGRDTERGLEGLADRRRSDIVNFSDESNREVKPVGGVSR